METKYEYVVMVYESGNDFLVMKLDLLTQFILDNCEIDGQEGVNADWKLTRIGMFTEQEIADKYPEQ